MWGYYKAKLGKVCDGVHEDSVGVREFRVRRQDHSRYQCSEPHVSIWCYVAAMYTGLILRMCGVDCFAWPPVGEPLAASVDWTTQGVVAPVRNQRQRGFAGLCPLQVQLKLRGSSQTSFCVSEPQLVHFDTADCGYTGGLVDSDFAFALRGELPVHRELCVARARRQVARWGVGFENAADTDSVQAPCQL